MPTTSFRVEEDRKDPPSSSRAAHGESYEHDSPSSSHNPPSSSSSIPKGASQKASGQPIFGGLGSQSSRASNRRFLQSEINKSVLQYRKGLIGERELLYTVDAHRHELFAEHPVEGNLLHYLIARGFTSALLKHILPGHPDAVLAVEHEESENKDGSEGLPRSTTLLRRAIERQDRAVIDGIFKAIAQVVRKCVELPPSQRESIYEVLLRLEDWRDALVEFPSLLENPAVRTVFALHPSNHRVITTDPCVAHQDHRLDIAYDEVRVLGADVAFPSGFWVGKRNSQERLSLTSWQGLKTIFAIICGGGGRRGGGAGGGGGGRGGGEGGEGEEGGEGQGDFPSSRKPHDHNHERDCDGFDGPPLATLTGLQAQESSVLFQEITETSGVEVDAALVPFPHILRAGDGSLLKLLCELYQRTGKSWLFELDAVALILDFKWKGFGRTFYKLLLGLSLLLAASFTIFSSWIVHLSAQPQAWVQGLLLLWRVLLLLNALPLLMQEVWSFRAVGFHAYTREAWNAVDMCALGLLYSSLGVSFFLPRLHVVYHVLSSLCCLLLWFKLLAYLRGFRHTGPLVSMMWQILIDMRFFLFVLTISVMGFGSCLYLLFAIDVETAKAAGRPVDADIITSYGSLKTSLLILFGALQGNWDSSVYSALDSSLVSPLVTIIFCLCCVCNTIILLNLLIALMGDSFDRVQENALAQGRYEQALSILQIEAMLPFTLLQDSRFFPRYLQVLRPKTSAGYGTGKEVEMWTGRLHQIYKRLEQSERRVNRNVEAVGKQLTQLEIHLGVATASPSGEEGGGLLLRGLESMVSSGSSPGRVATGISFGAGVGAFEGLPSFARRLPMDNTSASASSPLLTGRGGEGDDLLPRIVPSVPALAKMASAHAVDRVEEAMKERMARLEFKLDRVLEALGRNTIEVEVGEEVADAEED